MALPLNLQETAEGRFLPRDAFIAAVRGRPVQISENSDRDFHGPLCNATAYFILGTVFLILVFYFMWNPRFLFATLFFFCVAAMALMDVASSNRLTFYRVDTVDGGEALSFATPSLDEARALVQKLRG
ncbi:MAG: hypothetical protein AAFR23_09520 [Pseudomonadota bacterium]